MTGSTQDQPGDPAGVSNGEPRGNAMSAENQPAGKDAAAKAAGSLAAARAAEDETVKRRRQEEDEALADKRAEQDRVLASAGHRLFLAAAAMTAAVNSGDLEQVRGANSELQEAVDAHLALSKQPE